MGFNRVIVCDLKEAVDKLPELYQKLGFKVESNKLALIKPNICGVYHPSLDLLSGVVETLLPKVESIMVCETRTVVCKPIEQFEKLGVTSLLKRFGERVQIADLSGSELIEAQVPNPHAIKKFFIPKIVFESNVLINVPKAGTLPTTRLTCALKNLFGLLPQKRKYYRYHLFGGMHKVIADVAQVVKPGLNVVEAGDRLILGTDALMVDVVACRYVDLDPLTVEHLKLVSDDRGEKIE
jgi:uncharacterized protein (DUF362 family)